MRLHRLKVKAWKETQCVRCGSCFRFLLERWKKVPSDDPEDACDALRHDVALQPCPECGCYQPDMIADWRARAHFILTMVPWMGLAGLIAWGCEFRFNNLSVWLALAFGLGCVLAHGIACCWNLNRNPQRNLDLAKDGRVEIIKDAHVRREPGKSRTVLPVVLLLTMGLGMLLISVAELMRMQANWRWDGSWRPGVSGPGDSVRTWFPTPIRSVKGLWRGTARAQVVNAGELALDNKPLTIETRASQWGQTIRLDREDGEETTTYPWVVLTLPDVKAPSGKRLLIRIDLEATYPKSIGNDQYLETTESYSHTAELILADAHAGLRYSIVYCSTAFAAFMLFMTGGLLLSYSARRRQRYSRLSRTVPFEEVDDDSNDTDSEREFRRGRFRRRSFE